MLAIIAGLSLSNSDDATAFLKVDAMEFLPGATELDPAVQVGKLSREDFNEACPKHVIVQHIVDEADGMVKRESNYWSAADRGTKVHKAVEQKINALRDPDLRSEVSAIKSDDEVGYGAKGSIRIDVLENVGDGTVCVYDLKTGKSRLTRARMTEIASNAHSIYPGTRRLLIIETRPRR